jgi:hypothetical protein
MFVFGFYEEKRQQKKEYEGQIKDEGRMYDVQRIYEGKVKEENERTQA